MKKELISSEGYVNALTTLFLSLLLIAVTNAWSFELCTSKDCKDPISFEKGLKFEGHRLARHKRSVVADLVVTDHVSRAKVRISRQASLLRLLKAVDTANGGECSCLLEDKRESRRKCHCNVAELLTKALQSLTSEKSDVDDFIAKMEPTTKTRFTRLVVAELRRALRAKALERIRLQRMRRRILRRRHLLKMYPRAAFDGKQVLSF